MPETNFDFERWIENFTWKEMIAHIRANPSIGTAVSASIVTNNGEVLLGNGTNNILGDASLYPERHRSPECYDWSFHAEKKAIAEFFQKARYEEIRKALAFNGDKKLKLYMAATRPLLPCRECMMMLAEMNVGSLYIWPTLDPAMAPFKPEDEKKYQFSKVMELLKQYNVVIRPWVKYQPSMNDLLEELDKVKQ